MKNHNSFYGGIGEASGETADDGRDAAFLVGPEGGFTDREQIGKLFLLRSVWAPQYLSAGTRTSPIESCSDLYSISCSCPAEVLCIILPFFCLFLCLIMIIHIIILYNPVANRIGR